MNLRQKANSNLSLLLLRRVILLGLMISFSSQLLFGETNRIVRIGAFQYYPGIFKDKDNVIKGFYVDMLDEIALKENWTIQYLYGTWAEGLERIKNNQVDILTSVAHTAERARFLDFCPTPLLTVWGELYVHEGVSYNSIADMAGKKIAIMKDDFNGASFRTLAGQFHIQCEYLETDDFDAVFQAIINKKVDGGVVNSTYGTARQRAYPVKTTGVVFSPFDIHFASLKDRNTDVLLKLNEYLDKWQKDKNSTYHKALRKWGHGMIEIMPRWVVTTLIILAAGLAAFGIMIVALRIKAVRRLRESEDRYRRLFEACQEGIWTLDMNFNTTLANQPLVEMLGYSTDEMQGRPFGSYLTAEDSADHIRRIEAGSMEKPERFERHFVRKDGSVCHAIVSISPILDKQNKPSGYFAMCADITHFRRLEEQLRQAQKMEAIGQLAGGVAHDFNNILAAMILNMNFLRHDHSLSPATIASIKELEMDANRAAALVRQLLLFSRRSVVQMRAVDLNEIIENMLKMLGRLLGEHISLGFSKKEELPFINADTGMIEQVLMNLTVNARDAMPKGGRLNITTSIVEISDGGPQTATDARPGCFACLAVEDSGCGMDEVVLQRIFEPFYTTKAAGQGTGLGLATIYGIVKQHRGWIEVQSKPGQGSLFKVFLPALAGKEASAPSTADANHESRGGTEIILLVEDESTVRKHIGANLRRYGYRVLEASNAVEALSVWIAHGKRIDLLLTDMVMPEGMSGLDLAERIKTEKLDLKVILSSGYSLDAAKNLAPNTNFLQKPYQIQALLKMVRSALDDTRQ